MMDFKDRHYMKDPYKILELVAAREAEDEPALQNTGQVLDQGEKNRKSSTFLRFWQLLLNYLPKNSHSAYFD